KDVEDSDALDVTHLMVSYEKLSDPRRDLAYYEDVFKKRTDPETAIEHVLADGELGPIVPPVELARRADERRHLAEQQNQAFQKLVDQQLEKAVKEGGLSDQIAQARAHIAARAPGLSLEGSKKPAVVIPAITPGDMDRVDIDMSGILRAVEQI